MRTSKNLRELTLYNVRINPRTIPLAVVSFILGTASIGVAYAWSGPTAALPNGNVAAPINVGSTDQVKNGGLGVNSLAVFGNSLLGGFTGSNAYLSFGEIPTPSDPSTGYGIRDNAGIIEFKNEGDTSGTKNGWKTLQELVCGLVTCTGSTKPAFRVSKTTSQAVTPGVWALLTWPVEEFDTNNNFVSNRFTPTVPGKYLLTLTAACVGSGGAHDQCQMRITKNGTLIVASSDPGLHNSGTSIAVNVTGIIDMNGTTDYVETYAYNGYGNAITAGNFSGALLSP